jgi:hypothetical protein
LLEVFVFTSRGNMVAEVIAKGFLEAAFSLSRCLTTAVTNEFLTAPRTTLFRDAFACGIAEQRVVAVYLVHRRTDAFGAPGEQPVPSKKGRGFARDPLEDLHV